MTKYYLNTNTQSNPNGNNEVHNEHCSKLPSVYNRKYLGQFNNCHEAVAEAKKNYPKADGCAICSPNCHAA